MSQKYRMSLVVLNGKRTGSRKRILSNSFFFRPGPITRSLTRRRQQNGSESTDEPGGASR